MSLIAHTQYRVYLALSHLNSVKVTVVLYGKCILDRWVLCKLEKGLEANLVKIIYCLSPDNSCEIGPIYTLSMKSFNVVTS